MTTKEMIERLEYLQGNDYANCKVMPDEVVDEIVARLKDHDTLIGIIDMCYLGIVKAYTMLRLGEMKESGK